MNLGKSFNLSLNFLQACLPNKAAKRGNKTWGFSSSDFYAGHRSFPVFFSNNNGTLCTCRYDFIALRSSLWLQLQLTICISLIFPNFLPTKYFFNARQNCLTPETVSSVIYRKLQQKWRLILVVTKKTLCFHL